MKAMICSPDGDTDFFDIVVGVLQGDTLVSFLFITCLDYLLQILIDPIRENDFTLKTEYKMILKCKELEVLICI